MGGERDVLSGKIAVMTSPGELEYQKYGLPKPASSHLLSLALRANVRGSVLHICRGHQPLKKRGGIRHEMAGRVVALGRKIQQSVRISLLIRIPCQPTCKPLTISFPVASSR